MRLMPVDLDQLIADDHQVRAVWDWVERLDLAPFHEQIRAVEGEAGRPAIDPKILLALWIQATLDGIGSAREVERMCQTDVRYQWICGGVTPGYHRLSDFRSNSEQQLDRVLTESVAVLMEQGLVQLERVAQDGMKVRANAGAGSLRTEDRLKELLTAAEEQVAQLKKELDGDASASTRRREAARRRHAEERRQRIEQALAQLPEVKKRKESENGKKKSSPRSSMTDPEARVMKMADGGFRPALNVHFVSDTKTKVVAAVEVNNHGTDQGMAVPLAEQVESRHNSRPEEWLLDGGCITLDAIDKLAARGTDVIGPVRPPRNPDQDPYEPRPDDSLAVGHWRLRMATPYAKEVYKQRAATAELTNAHARRHGLLQFFVRGVQKARSVVLLLAITHNMRRGWALAC